MKLGRDRATTTKKLDQTDQKRANTNPPPNLRTLGPRKKSVIRVPLDEQPTCGTLITHTTQN